MSSFEDDVARAASGKRRAGWERWSKEMLERVNACRDAGLNVYRSVEILRKHGYPCSDSGLKRYARDNGWSW